MTTGTDLTLDATQASAMMNTQMKWAQAVSKASILPDAYKNKPSDILIAVGFGQSMGLSPAESLYRINVIKGKPTMSAELIAAQVRKAGHRLRISKDEKNLSATVTIVRCDDPDYPFTVTRDRAWAHNMGLDSKENYKRQPMTMLTWRAITACAREACPEALYGVAYTPDEMHDMDQPVTATVVDDPAPGTSPTVPNAADRMRAKVGEIMRANGVDSTPKAMFTFERLTGMRISSPHDLSAQDAENLLSSEQLLVERIREAVADYDQQTTDSEEEQ